jgi:hypothetical protein
MLTREELTEGPGTPPSVKGLVWYTDGSRTRRGTSAAVCGQSSGIRLRIYLAKYVTVFQAEIYAILTSGYEILMNARPKKYISIFSNRE